MWPRSFQYLFIALFVLSVPSIRGAPDEIDWWESASLYQIYPRSFQDSNGDGVGDLNGITSRLAYLKEIGITATWLSPIFESPMADFGYDISNFTKIDPIFGTMEDFEILIATAKKLGVKVLLDFVPNHSSDECEWFQKSIRREEGYEDFYVWEDGIVDPNNSSNRLPPSNWVSVFGGSQWEWNHERQQFYLHQFLVKQPDLNFSNPSVRKEMLNVLEFWLDRGVDGFRIDAVPHVFEKRNPDGTYPDEPPNGWGQDPNAYDYHDHIYTKDQYATIELLYEWREFLDLYKWVNNGDTRVLLAEAYSSIETLSQYFGNGTHYGVQMPMNFNLIFHRINNDAYDMEGSVKYWMDTMWKNHQSANWIVGNHDNRRIGTRLGRERIDIMNIIVNTLPGASVTYYGEEIGMVNVPTECTEISCDNRDPERTPMQWTPGHMAGFTTGSWTWLPIADDYDHYNVQTERGVSRSSLQLFKGLQKLKNSQAFRAFKDEGGFAYCAVNKQVFQVVRAATGLEEYRIVVNLGDKLEVVSGLSDKTMEYVLFNSYSPHRSGEKVDLRGKLYLMPYEAIVLRWAR